MLYIPAMVKYNYWLNMTNITPEGPGNYRCTGFTKTKAKTRSNVLTSGAEKRVGEFDKLGNS